MRSHGVWAVARVHMATWPDAPMGGRTRGVAGWQGHGGLITLGRATRVAASPHDLVNRPHALLPLVRACPYSAI